MKKIFLINLRKSVYFREKLIDKMHGNADARRMLLKTARMKEAAILIEQ